jgi:hypothetical protein
MNAWCIGARRRPTHGGGGDADGGGDGTATASGERESGAGTTGAGQRVNHLHQGHPPSERDHKRELELKRGTRRARVCIGVLFVGSLALASGRPFYAPYIDVFGDPNANATATSGGAVLAAAAAAAVRGVGETEETNRRAKVWIPVRVARARID